MAEKYHYTPPVESFINDDGLFEDIPIPAIDHMGRPKIDHCPNGCNKDRHTDNLSRFTGWYGGVYYHEGVQQNT